VATADAGGGGGSVELERTASLLMVWTGGGAPLLPADRRRSSLDDSFDTSFLRMLATLPFAAIALPSAN